MKAALPCAVGSGRADVRYKAHALCHSERLTSTSWSETLQLLNSTFSLTGDLGTERVLPIVRIPLAQLFGDWVLQGAAAPAADADAPSDPEPMLPADGLDAEFQVEPEMPAPPPPPPVAPDSLVLNLTRAIYIAGLLHIVNNCVSDLKDVMSHWPVFINQLRHVS
eukprot:1868470-Alexandrium_andersonii.AAC.1